jgi:hypothetical protein
MPTIFRQQLDKWALLSQRCGCETIATRGGLEQLRNIAASFGTIGAIRILLAII